MTTTFAMPSSPPVRCFLSYAHIDDEDFGFVDPLRKSLSSIFEAATGRALNIFVDRESIGWGQDWREKIATSVNEAVVFLPVITARYFGRTGCRDEFLAYYAKSEEIGVTDLILPIILTGSDMISSESTDEIVLIIERLQHRNVEHAWLDGYTSPAWRQEMFKMVADLKDAIARVEDRLVLIETPAEAESADTGDDPSADPSGDVGGSEGGAMDLLAEFVDEMEQMTPLAEQMSGAIEDLGNVAEGYKAPKSDNPRIIQASLAALASRFEEPARRLETTGGEMAVHAVRADSRIRSLLLLANESGMPDLRASVIQGIERIAESLSNLEETADQMAGLLESMRSAEIMSASIRRALKPARNGVRGVLDTIQVTKSWGDLDLS